LTVPSGVILGKEHFYFLDITEMKQNCHLLIFHC
jgi:hypothetical protein